MRFVVGQHIYLKQDLVAYTFDNIPVPWVYIHTLFHNIPTHSTNYLKKLPYSQGNGSIQ